MLRTGIETIICLSPNFLYVYVYVCKDWRFTCFWRLGFAGADAKLGHIAPIPYPFKRKKGLGK